LLSVDNVMPPKLMAVKFLYCITRSTFRGQRTPNKRRPRTVPRVCPHFFWRPFRIVSDAPVKHIIRYGTKMWLTASHNL
jgi:hypothetical protein